MSVSSGYRAGSAQPPTENGVNFYRAAWNASAD